MDFSDKESFKGKQELRKELDYLEDNKARLREQECIKACNNGVFLFDRKGKFNNVG
jgi:hypothetical protein